MGVGVFLFLEVQISCQFDGKRPAGPKKARFPLGRFPGNFSLDFEISFDILPERGGENSMDFMSRFARDPEICGGEPIIKGTRITLKTLLASLAEGASFEEILTDFPSLKREDLMAVVAFAAASAQEDIPFSPLPKVA